MELSGEEIAAFRLQSRYEQVCKLLGWSLESRQIGRLLLECDPGAGLSERAIARETQIPRSTVKRKLIPMLKNRIVENVGEINMMTNAGRAFHVQTHREIWRIGAGQQVGLSKEMIYALAQLPDRGDMDMGQLAELSFPADIPQTIQLKIW